MGNTENNYNVLDSALRLSRALKRNAPKHDHMLPPAVERTLVALNENNGLSSGELCEALGVRPSSLSELIDRMEKHGLAERSIDEQDKRIVRISLTEQGAETAAKIAEKINSRKAEVQACFDEGEAEQFCKLADKLSAHLQGGEDDLPPFGGRGPRGGRHGCRRGPHGFGHGFGPDNGPQAFGPGFGPGNGPQAFGPGFGPGNGPQAFGPGFGPHNFGHGFGPGHGRYHGNFRPGCGRHRHAHHFKHPALKHCHRHAFRHPGPWDCHRPEFRSC